MIQCATPKLVGGAPWIDRVPPTKNFQASGLDKVFNLEQLYHIILDYMYVDVC